MGKDERRLVDKKSGRRLTDDELKKVNGGDHWKVDNPDADYVNIRSDPGMNHTVVGRVNNGDYVNTTGSTRKVDGLTWYQIDHPANGWIVGIELIVCKLK